MPNGSGFNGRPGAEPHWSHKDRSSRPVRSSAWLSSLVGPPRVEPRRLFPPELEQLYDCSPDALRIIEVLKIIPDVFGTARV